MMSLDETALICDLAETYHIYDIKSLPLSKVATFSVGLREDSRIKLKIAGLKYPIGTMLLASIVDKLSLIIWQKTEDGVKGRNKPEQLLSKLLNSSQQTSNDHMVFDTVEDFEQKRREILEKGVT